MVGDAMQGGGPTFVAILLSYIAAICFILLDEICTYPYCISEPHIQCEVAQFSAISAPVPPFRQSFGLPPPHARRAQGGS
jgi:hypothetical protein